MKDPRDWAELALGAVIDVAQNYSPLREPEIEQMTEDLKRIFEKQAAELREECAVLCDTYEGWCPSWGQTSHERAARAAAKDIAVAIRKGSDSHDNRLPHQ